MRRSLLPLAALLLPTGAAAQPLFPFDAPWAAYNTVTDMEAGDPVAFAVADFDGDGDPDVVTARGRSEFGGGGFSFLRNDGRGRLAPPVLYSGASNSWGIAAADFDEDGRLDVVVSNANYLMTSGNTVSVFPGLGDGTFGARRNVSVGAGPIVPQGLAAADFDADGHLDLAVAAYGIVGGGSTVQLLRGNGDGTFAAPVAFPAGDGPYKLVAADLTGDGRPDLVVSGEDMGVSVLRNDGAGGFLAPVTYEAAPNTDARFSAVAVADVEGDGDLDVFAPGPSAGQRGQILVYRNGGTGALSVQGAVAFPLYTATPWDLAAADLTGDGRPDLIAAHHSGRTGDGVVIALNDGAGGFGEAVRYPGGQGTYAVGAADMDGDGARDVLTTDDFSMAVTVRLNPGTGLFPAVPDDFAESVQYYLDAGDLDGDGDLDAFTSGAGVAASQGALVFNDGTGRFPVQVDVAVPVHGVAYGVLRDLNGDGRPDLLFNNVGVAPSSKFYVALNNGDGTFPAPTEYAVPESAGWGHIDAFDLDGDGDLDVVDMEADGAPGVGNRFFVFLNQGDGTLVQGVTYTGLPFRPYGVAGGDFDHDGDADLAMTAPGAYGYDTVVMVVPGNGNGTFGASAAYTVARGPKEIVAAHLDGDGHLDLAVSSTGYDDGAFYVGEEKLTVLFGTGAGAFTRVQSYYAPFSPDLLGAGGLRAGDVDGDGDLDVLLQAASNDVSIYVNDGAGAFAFPYRLGFTTGAHNPYWGDFTGDGVPDLAAVSHRPPLGFDAGVAVLRGVTGVATAPEPGAPGAAAAPLTLAVAPNPVAGRAAVTLALDRGQTVAVALYDALGRRVATLHEGPLTAGAHALALDAAAFPAGVYVVRATAGGEAAVTHRFVVAR